MNNKVSIIMGVYNCADTIANAIDSILAQTYKDWILIMCDDGSSDDTFVIAKNYQERYPQNIKLVQNPKNMGLGYSLNHCLKYVDSEYVARMDSDDLSLPERFEEQVQFLDMHDDVSVVGTGYYLFDDNGIWGEAYEKERPSIKDIWCAKSFAHPTVMMRTKNIKAVGGYTVSKLTTRAEDYDLWCKLYQNGAIVNKKVYHVLIKLYTSCAH